MYLCVSAHRFQDINDLNCYFENICQGDRVRHWQWRHLVANINIYKRHIAHFCASSNRFREINTFYDVCKVPLRRNYKLCGDKEIVKIFIITIMDMIARSPDRSDKIKIKIRQCSIHTSVICGPTETRQSAQPHAIDW